MKIKVLILIKQNLSYQQLCTDSENESDVDFCGRQFFCQNRLIA